MNRIFIAAFLAIAISSCNNNNSNYSTEPVPSEISAKRTFNDSYNSLEEAEIKLIDIFDKRYNSPEKEYDFDCYMLNEELIDFICKEPRTLDYPFDSLQSKEYATVVTSEDGNLRFYYWDNRMGGTYISWSNICQYRSGGKVYTYKSSIMNVKHGNASEEPHESCSINSIKTIYDESNSPIYLVYAYLRLSSNLGYSSIEAIKIEGDKLVAVPIFADMADKYDNIDPESKEYVDMCSRGLEYSIADWYFRTNHGEGWDWLFSYDDKTNMLYIPLTGPEQGLSDRYSLYHFDGKKLCYIGEDAGFWLHPTLRSFNYLYVILETKDYKIRIDEMHDSSFRYAAWKNEKSMDNMPDIILYNGVYDERYEGYRFNNNDYEYIVNEDNGLVVKHRGKTILSQKTIR